MEDKNMSSGVEKVERTSSGEDMQIHDTERENKMNPRRRRRKEEKENGGWMAAVITLGVATLILSSVVAAGAVDLAEQDTLIHSGYRSNFYELVGIMDDIENDLLKLDASTTLNEQRAIATELLVSSSLAEGAIERLPMDGNGTNGVSSYVNHLRDFSSELLRSNQRLSGEQYEEIETLYEKQVTLKSNMNELANSMEKCDFADLMKGEGRFCELFNSLEEKGKEKVRETSFVEGELTATTGEDLLLKYFKDYGIEDVSRTGEARRDKMTCYNYTLTDERGRELFVQLSKNGELLFFDSYEKCSAKNYTLAKCESIANDFLSILGMKDMQSVFVSESGTTVDFTFVPVQNGILCYPDEVKVKVCETKGKVIGMEAYEYYDSHEERVFSTPRLTKGQAEDEVSVRLEVEKTSLALIPVYGKEVLCYEVYGSRGEHDYLVYVDAESGDEVAIYSIVNTKQGKILK